MPLIVFLEKSVEGDVHYLPDPDEHLEWRLPDAPRYSPAVLGSTPMMAACSLRLFIALKTCCNLLANEVLGSMGFCGRPLFGDPPDFVLDIPGVPPIYFARSQSEVTMIILRTTIARASAEAVSLPQGLAVTTRHAALHGREDSSEPTGILLPVSFKFI